MATKKEAAASKTTSDQPDASRAPHIDWALVERVLDSEEANLLVTFLAFALDGMIGWTLAPTVPILLITQLPMAIGAGSFNSLINSAISKAVSRDEIGGMLGFGAGLESSTRVVMPALASYLLGAYDTSTPGIMGSVVLAIVLVYAYLNLIVTPTALAGRGS